MRRTSRQNSFGISLLLGIVSLFFAVFLSPSCLEAAARDLKYESEAAKGINDFAIDLYLALAKRGTGDIFFSPQNISAALAMAYAGASGENAAEMAKVMHFGKDVHKGMGLLARFIESGNGKDSGTNLWTANAVWPTAKKGVNLTDSFAKIIKEDYRGEIRRMDYPGNPEKARREINAWAEKKTNGRIKDVIPEKGVDRNTPVVLTSAAYFLGKWTFPFDKSRTTEEPFYPENGSGKTRKVMLMCGEMSAAYDVSDAAQVISLSYRGKEEDPWYAMVFALPAKGTSLAQYEKTLRSGKNREQLQRVINGQSRASYTRVFIPKFQVEKEYALKEFLIGLGMKRAFKGGGFGNMMTGGMAAMNAIAEVYHKTFIELDEEKTEAAAATMVTGMPGAASFTPPPVFRADRPFLYFLVEKQTGTIMFMGRYTGSE